MKEAMRSRTQQKAKRSPSAAEQIRAYIQTAPAATRARLRTVRALIRATAPASVEHFSYGIPGSRLDGRPLVWYGGWREHVSLYPITAAIQRTFARQLARYETSKGTIRLPLDRPLPTALIKRLVKARIAEVTGGTGGTGGSGRTGKTAG
jgi:uncharacterized protein YdhG (YjbR/CyaY superfamily)